MVTFLRDTPYVALRTDLAELDQASEVLAAFAKGKGDLARAVRSAQECLVLRRKRESLRNLAIEKNSPLHVLRIGKATSKPSLGIVNAVGNAWEHFLTKVGELADAGEPRVTPLGSAPGSYELTLSVVAKENAADFSLRVQDALKSPETFPGLATTMTEVAVAARRSERLEVTVIAPERAHWLEVSCLDKEGALQREELLRHLSKSLNSMDIPQADNIERVLKAIELTAAGDLSAETLGLTTPRQVDYYKHAGRLLGMLDEGNELTSTGRQLVRVSDDERYTMMATLFEVSKCGEAWIAWANVSRFPEVPKGTAVAFLAATTSGLSENTIGRRAQTLEKWLSELAPRHYASTKVET